jgi:hypothetical protein
MLINTQNIIYSLINNNNDYIIGIIISLGIILLASSIGKAVLDHGHKVLTATAAGVTIYKQLKPTNDSGSEPEDDDKNKDNKKDNKLTTIKV